MIKTNLLGLLFLACSFLTGCATYHMSTESLVKQFGATRPEEKVIYTYPLFFIPFSVMGNDLKAITVLDKNEKEKVLTVTNRTGVRITKQDGSRTTFYFNTLMLQDSTITGSKTHFFEAHIKPIKFNNITKIELQN